MNIQGLDYNTNREKLILPEYGREVQKMVDYAVSLPDKDERQRCAETIISVMDRMMTHNRNNIGYKQKLWDHLAIMSGFKLDIDYPCDVTLALAIASKPDPMKYPMTRIRVRHYGHLMLETLDRLKAMEPGEERNELARLSAEQMKRNLEQWGHGTANFEKVVDDIARFTDGAIQLDARELQNSRFNRPAQALKNSTDKKRKKKSNR